MSETKRDSERFDLPGTMPGDVMVLEPTEVCQISDGGMQVETSVPLQVDSLHQFRLRLGEHAIVVKGRVAHSRIVSVDRDIVSYRSGIQFIEPSEPVALAIKAFIESIQRARDRKA